MTTALVWLLISLPPEQMQPYNPGRAPFVVAQFADGKECQRIGSVLMGRSDNIRLECIQARVVIKD